MGVREKKSCIMRDSLFRTLNFTSCCCVCATRSCPSALCILVVRLCTFSSISFNRTRQSLIALSLFDPWLASSARSCSYFIDVDKAARLLTGPKGDDGGGDVGEPEAMVLHTERRRWTCCSAPSALRRNWSCLNCHPSGLRLGPCIGNSASDTLRKPYTNHHCMSISLH